MTFAEIAPERPMPEDIIPEHVNTEYLAFRLHGRSKSGKTEIWRVLSQKGLYQLGQISWYPSWRQYSFNPEEGTTFNHSCLAAISSFLQDLNAKQRKG